MDITVGACGCAAERRGWCPVSHVTVRKRRAHTCSYSPYRLLMPQVRREALQTLETMLLTVQAEGAATPALAAEQSTAAVEGVPERPKSAAPPLLGSGAYEALSAQRSRLLAALEGCRHDSIAAVRAAAAQARTAALGLAVRVTGSSTADSSHVGAPEGAAVSPGRPRRPRSIYRSPLKMPAAVGAGCRPIFHRHKLRPGELQDFGVQVYAPPSPPRRCQPQEQVLELDSGDSPARREQQQQQQQQQCQEQQQGLQPEWGHHEHDQQQQQSQQLQQQESGYVAEAAGLPRDHSSQADQDKGLPPTPPLPAIHVGAQTHVSAQTEGHDPCGADSGGCSGWTAYGSSVPMVASPPGSPPFLYRLCAHSGLMAPGAAATPMESVARIEVAHVVQGRVELVYGGGNSAGGPGVQAAAFMSTPAQGNTQPPGTTAAFPWEVAPACQLPQTTASPPAAVPDAGIVPSTVLTSGATARESVYNEWRSQQQQEQEQQRTSPRQWLPQHAASATGEDKQALSGGLPGSRQCSTAQPHMTSEGLADTLTVVRQASCRVDSLLRELSMCTSEAQRMDSSAAAAGPCPGIVAAEGDDDRCSRDMAEVGRPSLIHDAAERSLVEPPAGWLLSSVEPPQRASGRNPRQAEALAASMAAAQQQQHAEETQSRDRDEAAQQQQQQPMLQVQQHGTQAAMPSAGSEQSLEEPATCRDAAWHTQPVAHLQASSAAATASDAFACAEAEEAEAAPAAADCATGLHGVEAPLCLHDDDGSLLMALSWRLQRLAGGFGQPGSNDERDVFVVHANQLRSEPGTSRPVQLPPRPWASSPGGGAAVLMRREPFPPSSGGASWVRECGCSEPWLCRWLHCISCLLCSMKPPQGSHAPRNRQPLMPLHLPGPRPGNGGAA